MDEDPSPEVEVGSPNKCRCTAGVCGQFLFAYYVLTFSRIILSLVGWILGNYSFSRCFAMMEEVTTSLQPSATPVGSWLAHTVARIVSCPGYHVRCASLLLMHIHQHIV
jgi:hypothetical protein